jgi:hypothetical protein
MLRIRRHGLISAAALVTIVASATTVRADDPADVDALIELVRKKPGSMSEDTWREKRREAARQLGRLGDNKAVPALIEVVEQEKFDVVAEIAIESLGRLKDDRAVDVLQDVVDDGSRDKYVREAARRALRSIGVKPAGSGGSGGNGNSKLDDGARVGVGGGGGGGGRASGGGGSILGDDARHDIPEGPVFDEDVLAATERLTFAAGDVGLTYDSVRETSVLTGDVHALYDRVVEKQRVAYGYGGSGDLAFGALSPPDDGVSSRAGSFDFEVHGEARAYMGGTPFYALAQGAAAYHGVFIQNEIPGPNLKELRAGQDLGVALGAGRGRYLDVGEGLRLRRLEQVLAESRMLGRPITPDLAAKLLRTWWALRGEQGAHRRLVATVTILRDAGVLLGEPDAGTTYKILQVLLDGQLDHRFSGVDVRLGFAEAFLRREEGTPAEGRDGRFEAVFSLARYGMQAQSGNHEIVGTAFATYRVLTEDGDAKPWTVDAEVVWRRFFYGDAWDPIGALEFGGAAGASDAGEPDGAEPIETGTRLEGRVGWSWMPSRATSYSLASTMRIESGELFLGVTFTGTWGLLDTSYVAGSALPGALE